MHDIILDTNPLAYIYNEVPDLGQAYASLLDELSKKNILIIPKIVYGELSLIFQDENELNRFLEDTGIIIGEMKPAIYLTAASRWNEYNNRRVLICQRCGKKLKKLICSKCKAEIKIRQHILSDFLIGSLATHTSGKKIVTHDSGYFSTYFPDLNIITI